MFNTMRQNFGRDDALAAQVIAAMDNIKRRSQAAYDELVLLLTAARFPTTSSKIMKLAWPQLQGMWTLISGFDIKTSADVVNILSTARVRPVIDSSIIKLRQPFTLTRSDGAIQHCFLAGAAPSAYTFLPSNASGVPSSNVAMSIFASALTDDELPMISRRSDQEILVRNHDLITTGGGADAKIRRVYLSSAGAIQTAYLKNSAGNDVVLTGAASFVDRPYIEDFCDGVNLWAMEYNATTSALRIHKVKLSTGTETIVVVSNIKLGAAFFEGAFYANGDHAVLLGQQATGGKSQVMFFELPDGNATTTLNFNVGAPPQVANSVGGGVIPYYTRPLVDGAELRGFHVSTLLPNKTVRAFLTPNLAGTSSAPINVVDINPVVKRSATPAATDTVGNVTVTKILGQTDADAVWPVPRTNQAVGLRNLNRVAVSADGLRILAINGTDAPFDTLVFNVAAKDMVSFVPPVSTRITSINTLSRINMTGARTLAFATILSFNALLELSF